MQRVAVRILHPKPAEVGPLERGFLEARRRNAVRLAELFAQAGADDVRSTTDDARSGSFGGRLRHEIQGLGGGGGLVVLGSGSIPLAALADAQAFVAAARSGQRRALANNRYSADVVALGTTTGLEALPDLTGDNALPRWLEEVGGFAVEDLRDRWRLAVDLDSPLDVLLTGGQLLDGDLLGDANLTAIHEALRGVRRVAGDRRAELVVSGRASAATLAWLETATASRTRMLVEERGLRASSREALGGSSDGRRLRPPRSVLGLVLDDRGPEAFGDILRELGDGALVDTRVLLAHRLGPDERAWPRAEDRFASDLLWPERIADEWLRDLTAAALEAPISIVLGGHTLVGPALRLALGEMPDPPLAPHSGQAGSRPA